MEFLAKNTNTALSEFEKVSDTIGKSFFLIIVGLIRILVFCIVYHCVFI